MTSKYKTIPAAIVLAFWRDCGLPAALAEHQFCAGRRWRFDYAWPVNEWRLMDKEGNEVAVVTGHRELGGVALEVQGASYGIGRPCRACGQRQAGRHNRGKALEAEREKLNAAARLGWRVLYCTPQELGTLALARQLKAALEFAK